MADRIETYSPSQGTWFEEDSQILLIPESAHPQRKEVS